MELDFRDGTLLLGPPGLKAELVPPEFRLDVREGGRYRALALAYADAHRFWHRAGVEVDDRARRYEVLADLAIRTSRKPHPHQQEALDAWLRARKRGLVVLPTGSGKTHVAELAIAAVQRSTLVIAPTVALVVQWRRVLGETFSVPVGMIADSTYDIQPITITTYDSAYKHMSRIGNRFGLVVFDEAHHLPAEAYSQAAEQCLAPYRLALTATPERSDGQEALLQTLVGPEVYRRSVSDLTGAYLSEYDVCVIPVDLTPGEREIYDTSRGIYLDFIRRQGVRMGDKGGFQDFLRRSSRTPEGRRALHAYRTQKLLTECTEGKLQVLADLFAAHKEAKILFFTNENKALFDISRRFLVPVIVHTTPASERLRLIEGLASGRTRILGASHTLSEGVDVPDVSVGIILAGNGSVREHVQRLGRLLRRQDGKTAVLYEIVASRTGEEFTSERRREHEAYGA